MFRNLINSILLIGFLTVFAIDSASSLFELNNSVICELTDSADGEDSNEEEVNKLISEAVLCGLPEVDPHGEFVSRKMPELFFCYTTIHPFRIPSPPPEVLI